MIIFLLFTYVLQCSGACEWVPSVRAANDTVVHVMFALPYSNEEESEALFQAISNPDSPQYRDFLSAKQAQALVAPKSEATATVQQFLKENFPNVVPRWSSWGHFVHFKLTVQEVEEMLNTQCFVYYYTCGGGAPSFSSSSSAMIERRAIRTVDNSFPEFVLSKHLAYVGGVTQFPFVRHQPKMLRKISEEVNETELSFEELRDRMSVLDNVNSVSSVFNPVQFASSDKQVNFLLTIVCPDGSPLVGTTSCRDGSKLDAVTIRSAHGSEPQRTAEYSNPRCGYSGKTYQCFFLVKLEDNWVRVAFGFDLLFDSGLTYSYNMQHFVVGTTEKTTDFVKRFYSVPSTVKIMNSSISYQAIGALTLKSADSTGFYSPNDLTKLYGLFGVPPGNVNLVDFKGMTNDPSKPDVETSLDIQWVSSMAAGARSTVWHSPLGEGESIEAIVGQIQTAALTNEQPYVLSLSYGGPELSTLPAILAQHEQGFKSLGLVGVTVLVASGDTGPYWDESCDMFLPIYPASSAYVTSVGATQLVAQNLHNSCKVEESVCSAQTGASITSGGGFSSMIARPAWQNEAVQEYLRGAMPDMKFNSANRAYPDISLFARLFTIVNSGIQTTVDGTSASAPALAGLITLINDALMHAGGKPLGFLNPALYRMQKENPESYHDVLVGFNGCTRTGCCPEGFQAREGWDAASGLGSPVFGPFATALGAALNGTWKPISFPEDLDCGTPLIQPNKESVWSSTKVWVIVVAVLVALLGVLGIWACWFFRQRRRRVVTAQLQQGLFAE